MAFKVTYFLGTGIFVSNATLSTGKRTIGSMACSIDVVRFTVGSLAIKYLLCLWVMEYPF